MGGRSERDEQDRGPHADVVDEDDRDHADGTDAHRGLAGGVNGPASLDETTGDPAAADAADVRNQVDGNERQADILQVDAVLLVQESRNPEEIEPPDRVGHELADGEGPGLSELQEAEPADLALLIGRVGLDVGELGLSDGRVLTRGVIGKRPPDDPDKADGTRDDESPFPTPGDSNPRHDERGTQCTDVGAGVEDAGR